MKTYIFKHSLLAAIWGLSVFGCADGDSFDYNKNVAFITGTETTPVVKFVVEDTPSSYTVTASSTNKVDKDVKVKFAIDNSLVEAYNQEHNTSYYAIPENAVVLENKEVVIEAGKAFSTPATVRGFCGRACLCNSCYDVTSGRFGSVATFQNRFLESSPRILFHFVEYQ